MLNHKSEINKIKHEMINLQRFICVEKIPIENFLFDNVNSDLITIGDVLKLLLENNFQKIKAISENNNS